MFSSCKWFFFSYNSEVVKLLLRYLIVIWYFMTKYWIFTYTFQLNHHSDSGGKYFLFHFIGGEVKDHRGKTVHLYICHGFPVIVSYCLTIYWASCAKSFQWYPLCVTPWTVAAKLLWPWDSPGERTGVGCHFLLQGIFPEPVSPALAGGFFLLLPPGKPLCKCLMF